MAKQKKSSSRQLDLEPLRESVESLGSTTRSLSHRSTTLLEQVDAQNRAFDDSLSVANEMTASLKETATQADSLTGSSGDVVSGINELAASIEQATVSATEVATAITQTASSMKQINASMQTVTASSQEMATSAQEVT